MDDILVPKSSQEYCCYVCDYKSCRKGQYERHCSTDKHKRMTDGLQNGTKSSGYHCTCGKNFKYRQGLHKHKLVCHNSLLAKPATNYLHNNNDDVVENIIEKPVLDTTLFMELIKQNKELQNLLAQQANDYQSLLEKQAADYSQKQSELIHKLVDREPGNTIVNGNNNTTNNNQKFNLNFFLNETCKDAMNIQEFMENLRITFNDLLKIGNDGFVNGVTDIFIKELRELDINKRPIHCTDSKRDTIYLKENGEWNKDDKEKTRLKQLIEKIEYKNVAVLQQWCNDTPDSKINNSDNNLLRDKIYLQTLQGDDHTRDKIIKNISKEVIVDKE
jgi:hypothetical protein